MPKVTKAVIAAAGFGTRFLPQTKAMPKEMLPLIDKPIIQYIVEDLVAAGIKDIIIVGSSNKRAIEDHFDMPSEDLLANLRAGGPKKKHYIDDLEAIANLANFVYIRQKGPYGTATPIMNAAHLIGDEPFIYAFADDLTVATPNAFQQMVALHDELQGGILPCIKIKEDIDYDRYGVIAGEQLRDDVLKMTGVIEKPGKAKAPSDFASVGGYLFTAEVFDYIEQGMRDLPEGKEFYVTDSIIEPMLRDGKTFYGCEIQNSKRYDTGDKLEYLKTVIDFGLAHEELGKDLETYLRSRLT
ncbi:MAG: sugar phosphate nucleotidyltransferase [Candidatus Saccharimonadales bacterium]